MSTNLEWYRSDKTAEERTTALLAEIDWERIQKRLKGAVDEVICDLHYYVEDTVRSDAAMNIGGEVNRRARDIIEALLMGNTELAEKAMGQNWQADIRSRILNANEEVIARGALGDAHRFIEQLRKVISDQNDKIVRQGLYAPNTEILAQPVPGVAQNQNDLNAAVSENENVREMK